MPMKAKAAAPKEELIEVDELDLDPSLGTPPPGTRWNRT